MQERIILAPGLYGNELTKNMALHGVDCFDLRIVSATELAKIALMRAGVSITEDFVDQNEELGIVAEAVNGCTYFEKTSYADLMNIVSAIRQMRSFVAAPDEGKALRETLIKGIFKEKNQALITVYDKYMMILQDRGKIDNILLIRKAIAEGKITDAEFYTLEEFQPDPISEALISKLSGGRYRIVSIRSLYNAEDKPLKIASYKNCYGTTNEVETIINDIYPDKKRVDSCTVAVTDSATYSQLFLDYSLLYNIPVTFGCGLPIINSYPAKLLALYLKWITSGFYSAGALKEMIYSGFFSIRTLKETLPEQDDKFSWIAFYNCLGDIGFSRDSTKNKEHLEKYKKALEEDAKYIDEQSKEYNDFKTKQECIPLLEVMAEEFTLPAAEFINKYAVVRYYGDDADHSQKLLEKLDMSAKFRIYSVLKTVGESGLELNEGDIIANVLKSSVLTQSCEPGCLHITTIDKAKYSVRDTLYIAGLSASKYPGSPKENYLLLDCDIRDFGAEMERFTSKKKIERKTDSVIELAELASALGAQIHVSYPGKNVSELKQDNASSLIFDLFSKTGETGGLKAFEAAITKVAYFEPALSKSRLVGQAYVDGAMIEPNEADYANTKGSGDLNREYSPSALEMYNGCPRRFQLQYVLGIPQPEEDDMYAVMSAADCGTLAHTCMEQLANSGMTQDEFLKLAGEFYDSFIDEHPPVMKEKIHADRIQFMDMMETAYIRNSGRPVVLKEEDIHCVHETGVKLHGFPDRVEDMGNGTYQVVDYKTKRKKEHHEDDPISCLQVIIYAYLMEQKGYKITDCEYRYIRLGEEVNCKYDNQAKDELKTFLEGFKNAMEKGVFPCLPDDETCKYCKFDKICGKMNIE